ncbi:hypothetical protein [Deinococcus cellulosilyticus]|uniref:Uncharacterized protein n=1 Tax=Deinococcus cellulosilyticus (strain DSM 18568 / NBRC 106333 / KACC 11606 / 5516J-15) TaxID=1223518 RepID=A0A511MYS7_DEIC1|nr:hypothetical protein [Deinococcus cellulosilyticus]GEM45297.1 hypothetical protein DC3_09320 [Deinococcus cellulosilyticus NBRC 106333 = KACC 11606]
MSLKRNEVLVLGSVALASLAFIGGAWIVADRLERAIRETNLSKASNSIGNAADKVSGVIDGVGNVVDTVEDWLSKFKTL